MARRNKAASANAAANAETETKVEAGTETETVTASDDTGDEAILAALEAADATEAESPFSAPVETTDVVTEQTEEIEVQLEEEDEDAVLAALATQDTSTAAPKKTAAKKSSTPAAPVVIRQFCDVADHLDDAKLKAALDGITAKKVAEKAMNVKQAIETGKKLSGFTKVGIKTLVEKGRVTSKELVEAFQADGKSLGTARAQAQQMTALFKALGIATPDATNARELVAADNGLVKELTLLAA